jgi:hypothetical protein
MGKTIPIQMFVQAMEIVIHSIIALVTLDILEINVNILSALELIQPISWFVLEEELAIFIIIAPAVKAIQEFNVNSNNVTELIQPIH